MTTVQEEVLGLWSSLSPMGEFVECGDMLPHSSESGDKSPHSTFSRLNDDRGRCILVACKSALLIEEVSACPMILVFQ